MSKAKPSTTVFVCLMRTLGPVVFRVPDEAKHRTDRSRAVLLVWFSTLRVLVSVSVLFSLSEWLNDLLLW